MLKMDLEHISNKKKFYILETIKWCSVIVLFIASIFSNHLCAKCSVSLRVIVCVLFTIIAVYIASITKIGKFLVIFGKESHMELKKVVWPSYRDGLNTTLIIIGVTVVVSLILWGLDTVIVYMISFGLRL